MDLGTIQKKFPGKGKANEKRPELREYRSPYEFRDDVRLVWANCRTYNAVGHAVRTMGDTMSEMWEKKWALSGIEAKWEDELHRQSLEEQVCYVHGPNKYCYPLAPVLAVVQRGH